MLMRSTTQLIIGLLFYIVGFPNSFQYALQRSQSNKVTLDTQLFTSELDRKWVGGDPPMGQSTVANLYYFLP
jgi:hypothetical protein